MMLLLLSCRVVKILLFMFLMVWIIGLFIIMGCVMVVVMFCFMVILFCCVMMLDWIFNCCLWVFNIRVFVLICVRFLEIFFVEVDIICSVVVVI